jgi:ADP-glucose pyrophosphorylase
MVAATGCKKPDDLGLGLVLWQTPMLTSPLPPGSAVITQTNIDRAVIGIRSVIENGTTIRNSVLMGADFYQAEDPRPVPGQPPLGIGARCVIEGAIIDENVHIGDGVMISPEGKYAQRRF